MDDQKRSRLAFKTRGDSSPNGKARVYYCGHQKDFEKFFDVIADDILAQQNVVIWYTQEQRDDDVPDIIALSQMQLFVVPVTKRFLQESSQCNILELEFAKEQNIPILYIIVEQGIDGIFAERIGELQYISKVDSDPTSIPYMEKLNNYLDAVLVGDKLSAQIKDAFDAYIFLSYRKKDREAAQELMKLIHKKDFCRKIAIWYDEFLIPGENFNEAIEKALDRSDLFAMVVTPNLINDENYVMRKEYPMAVDKEKPILPVEMVATDSEKLKSCYAGIPTILTFDKKEKLHDVLVNALPIALQTDEENLQHTYFVGLAYLLGIDVELNKDYGIEMITESANAGLCAAIKKMAEMYYYGNSVSRDYTEAIEWQRKLVDIYSKSAEETRDEADVFVTLKEVVALGDMLYQAARLDEAMDIFERACRVGKVLAFGTIDKGVVNKMKTLFKKYSGRSEYYEDSLYYLCYSIKMLLIIHGEVGIEYSNELNRNASWVTVLTENYGEDKSSAISLEIQERVGLNNLEYGNLEQAETIFNKTLEGWRNLAEKNNEYGYKYRLVTAYIYLSEIDNARNNYMDSFNHLDDALEVLRQLYGEYPDKEEVLFKTIEVDYRKGKACMLLGDEEAARYYAERTNKNTRRGEEEGFVNELKKIKGLNLLVLGDIESEQKKIDCYTEAYSVLSTIADNSLLREDAINAAEACNKLGTLNYLKEDYEQADEWFKKAKGYMEVTVQLSKSIRDVRLMADCYENIFRTSIKRNRSDEAKEYYEKARFSRKSLATSTNASYDINKLIELERFRRNETIPKDVQENALGAYVMEKAGEIELDEQGLLDEVKTKMAEIVNEFWKAYMFFKRRQEVGELSLILSKKREGEINLYHIHKIANEILNNLEPYFKYDEIAMLVLSFCSYYELINVKRVIGGKNKAIEDFRTFFRCLPFWDRPLSEIDYLGEWVLMYKWVSA